MSIHEIVGTVTGEVTLGHVDVFMGYLKRKINGEDDVAGALEKLSRVDARVWALAMRHEDFKILWDAIMVKAALGMQPMTKEQREWFKLVALRAGVLGDPGKKGAGRIVINNINHSAPPTPKVDWIDPREGTLGGLKRHQTATAPSFGQSSPVDVEAVSEAAAEASRAIQDAAGQDFDPTDPFNGEA